jgi:formylglycine-generating enzyme required for sulfatase activity/predicted Ser/Thr protein kinase
MLNPGTILQNRYQIIQRIGGGGMGDVYLAADLRLGNNRVVVKENRGGDPQLFQAEATILAVLQHTNLPRVIDHFVEPPPPVSTGAQYLVMDYIAGQNLEQMVQARGLLPEGEVLGWFRQILDAVKYLHANRIIHRDIKPQNIIIMPSGRAVLVDFGIAKVMQPGRVTASGARGWGSPGYAPPEQYTGGTDERSDVYSLGATMYFALMGMEPPSAPERAYGNPLASLCQRNASVAPRTEQVILQAMTLAGAQRYPNIAAMEQALWLPPTMPVPPQPPPAPAQPLNPLPIILGTLAVVLLLGALMMGMFVASGAINLAFLNAPTPWLTTALPTKAPEPTKAPIAPTAAPPTKAPEPTKAPVAPTAAPRAGDTRAFAPDNAPMVFVPAGEFLMGSSDADRDASSDEKPQHTVYLDAFWIDKYEVTNALYKKCVDAGKCSRSSESKSYTRSSYYGNASFDNYPVIYISWNDANAYCAWAGKYLPTEAEWEKAARGADARIYPWGNQWDVRTTRRLNFSDKNDPTGPSDEVADDGYADTAPVGSYPSGTSPYGTLDMAGNVWEWVADWYGENYYASSPRNNPKGPSSGSARVVRGGAWSSVGYYVRAAYRYRLAPTASSYYVGFRCARSP